MGGILRGGDMLVCGSGSSGNKTGVLSKSSDIVCEKDSFISSSSMLLPLSSLPPTFFLLGLALLTSLSAAIFWLEPFLPETTAFFSFLTRRENLLFIFHDNKEISFFVFLFKPQTGKQTAPQTLTGPGESSPHRSSLTAPPLSTRVWLTLRDQIGSVPL
ncbi:hypothetical protein XENTR_v10007604 [Xenopus tropicalis]|nr:hypothetical protein XENTR_v10007604 [Xenopus tropicalis]